MLILLAILLLPLLSINTQQKPTDEGWFNKPFSFVGEMFSESFFGFSQGIRHTTRMYLDLINIKKENQDLKKRNQELLAQQQTQEELKIENDRLRGLLSFKASTKMQLQSAQIISRDALMDHETIQINKGSEDGLKAGQAVISTDGVIGYIFRPQKNTSHVLLITDRFSVVDGIVSRSRAQGIVEGKGRGGCLLRYIEKSQDVKPGDKIITSGLDNIFPKGLPIAVVTDVVTKPYSASLIVEMSPIVDPNKVEELFIVLNAMNEEIGAVSASTTAPTEAANPAPTTQEKRQ